MDKHLNWLKDNKCENISVNVLVENKSTIRFYESLGFKQNIINMEIPLKKFRRKNDSIRSNNRNNCYFSFCSY